MLPVSIIDGKVRPCFECSGFVHSWYYEAEVVNNGFFVRIQYTSTSSLVVAPFSEKFGGKMVVIIACHFTNECYLSCCNLFFDVEYIKKFPHYRLICDALIFNLSHAYA